MIDACAHCGAPRDGAAIGVDQSINNIVVRVLLLQELMLRHACYGPEWTSHKESIELLNQTLAEMRKLRGAAK